MNPRTAWLTLLSLLLLAISIESRKDPGEYWTSVMKDQPMPEAIQGLVHRDSAPSQPTKNANCDHDHPSMGTRNKNQPFAGDFEPRPNVSSYNDDDVGQEEKKFVKDFEPRPSASAYNDDDVDQKFVKDIEPRPDATVYRE
ncbi:hypothetical protein FH972_005014 [Carpinus fangiana]|uniref:Organ-specific protein S2 n=1 Tax=Carpinus fangiana TaxID=176857 RepID=A0A5N6QR94_9ROSI|nr:hypothetical protein FH972_005014 [Carpinus fangiana]